ncbi:DKNYY family protein [Aquimarina sp. MAR_2010_214]|uniref:DKNYY domain-containing protein n=1 Tax=Aquimarina sp. MAR_2010_214 TaxID=1250026 RepID=UPI000C701E01|nr:DKNYY domain-containing protein [Aquimarina sp. MAR_2010_214]PKV52299.1 DKNYY family protein [Aquimarina sp. MAR_2010_214]
MADPTGIIVKAKIKETALKKFLNTKQKSFDDFDWNTTIKKDYNTEEYRTNKNKKTIAFFAELLYSCNNNSGDIFLFHYNNEKQEFFFSFILNHEYYRYEKSLLTVCRELANYIEPLYDAYAFIVAPGPPDIYNAFSLKQENIKFKASDIIDKNIAQTYLDRFWSFNVKDNFSCEPEAALRKRNYYYKPLKNAYKKLKKEIEEIEKPSKIKKATKDHPYHLFGSFYTYDGFVYENETKIENADPLTFREIGPFFVDKNHVFKYSAINMVEPFDIRNWSKMKFEYRIIEGIDGATFTHLKKQHPREAMYWKDKNYIFSKNYTELKKIEPADVKTFEYLDFAYGKDKNLVYCADQIIDIDPKQYKLNKNGFISDNKNIYHYGNKIDLDANTFEVILYESETNPFFGPFVLADKHGKYSYEYKHDQSTQALAINN